MWFTNLSTPIQWGILILAFIGLCFVAAFVFTAIKKRVKIKVGIVEIDPEDDVQITVTKNEEVKK